MGAWRPAADADESDPRSGRELVTNGPSQVSKAQAMRVRDVSRPTADELAEAEETVLVVHRNWKPRI